jgi:hypothetical protein
MVTVCFLWLAVNAAYAAVGDRHFEQAGAFSLQAPRGWQFRDYPGMKYQIAHGPVTDSFSPNINVVDEAYGGTFKSYVDASANALARAFVEFTLLTREAFVTANGLRGERLITTARQQKYLLRQTYYIFPGANGRFLVVTCSTLAAGGEKLDTVFEESLKTFELAK